MTSRRLIITGDDFGASREVNEAVILAHRRGILTSASLMVSGQAFDHAVTLAKENPRLAVGLHVTCADGTPVMPPSEIPHLVNKNGTFPSDPARAGLRYFFCPNTRKELFNEIAAQFEKFSRSGLNFSHVDGHCHLHVHPVVLDAVAKLCESYGIKRVRIPSDSFFSALPFLASPRLSAGYALVFKLLTARMKRKLTRRGFIFPQRVYGNLLTGKMSLEYVLSLLDSLPPGGSEIYFHPALPCSPATYDSKQFQRFREFRILIDPCVRSKIERLGIIPSTYFDLDNDL
ncbi:MAG: hopanoid biosynthesis-associated protein HpnK [Syntrophobacteraceae bacterium]|jgi:hopanoid biosynthesis associated protein HpnK